MQATFLVHLPPGHSPAQPSAAQPVEKCSKIIVILSWQQFLLTSITCDCQKPEDWLDDEPEYVHDPNSVKPDDWDEEEDGEWEAPQIGET